MTTMSDHGSDCRLEFERDGCLARRLRQALLAFLLITATAGGLAGQATSAAAVSPAAGPYVPSQTDDDGGTDEPSEPAEPSDGDVSDDEPAPEPDSVPIVVWIGAGALVTAAIIWAVTMAGGND